MYNPTKLGVIALLSFSTVTFALPIDNNVAAQNGVAGDPIQDAINAGKGIFNSGKGAFDGALNAGKGALNSAINSIPKIHWTRAEGNVEAAEADPFQGFINAGKNGINAGKNGLNGAINAGKGALNSIPKPPKIHLA